MRGCRCCFRMYKGDGCGEQQISDVRTADARSLQQLPGPLIHGVMQLPQGHVAVGLGVSIHVAGPCPESEWARVCPSEARVDGKSWNAGAFCRPALLLLERLNFTSHFTSEQQKGRSRGI